MQGSSLNRAQRLGNTAGRWRTIVVVGALSALLVPLLVLDLGLILQVLISRGSQATPHDWELGPWTGGHLVQWSLAGSETTRLTVLVAASWVLAFLEAASLLLLRRLVNVYALDVASELRRAIYRQAFLLGPHDLLGASRSRPEELFADKAETVRRGLVLHWIAIPRSVVELLLLMLLAVAVNHWLTLLAVLLTVYILWSYRGLKRRGEAAARVWRNRAQERCVGLLGALRLAPLATGYLLDAPPGERFDAGLQEYRQADFRALTGSESLLKPLLVFIVLSAVSFVFLVIGLSPEVTVAGTVLLGAAIIRAYFPASRLYRLRAHYTETEAAAGEIFAYLDRQPGVVQIVEASPLERLERDIELDKVTIADRHGRRLLDRVSMTIPAGQVSAIVASDPHSPMAVAGLFVRYYDPAAGRILFDQRDICRATLETVRGQAVLVTADGPIFPGTLAENLACGNSGFTPLQLTDAIKQVQLDGFLGTLSSGLSTLVGVPETPLRIDQAFRIGLARALLREPSLLVVQEPDGRFDEATSRELDEALKRTAGGRTLITLPARLATLRTAEHIYLLHEGAVHAQGNHADLLQTSELYRHLNYVRFNAFRDRVKW